MVIKVYITSVSANKTLKKNQQLMMDTLTAKGIPFELIDISSPENEEEKAFMRAEARPADGQPNPMPPQIFADSEYLGDYDAFYEATEDNALDVFLKLAGATKTSEAEVSLQVEDKQPVEVTEEKHEKEATESTEPADQPAANDEVEANEERETNEGS